MQYIYLHGFASSPQSDKAQYLKRCFATVGINLEIIDLNQGDFTNLSLTRQIKQTVAAFKTVSNSVTLVGSSFGGLTAAWIAEKYPQVKRLILLAPAFNFLAYWLPQLGEAQVKQWQESGYLSVYHYGADKLLPLSYEFVVDAAQYEPNLLQRRIPTLIIHGTQDETIPVKASIEYKKSRSEVKLLTPNSDHSLHEAMEYIWQEIQLFCSL
ncbi:MAG TPA: YqiA/YcfP family alpha/beta fold hydrolase [Xenococcaceae cyanobacterium]|jgi:pimeloyl-ACP methyl ester carboxylesterase